MKRWLSLSLILAFAFASGALADDKTEQADEAKKPADSAVEKLKENPDDLTALQTYLNLNIRRLIPLMNSNPDAAEKQLQEMNQALDALEPTTDQAKQLLQSAKSSLEIIEQRLQLTRTSLAELEAKLQENPDDVASIGLYVNKAMLEITPLTRSEPDKAEARLQAVAEVLEKGKEAAKEDASQRAYEQAARLLSRLESAIESAKKLTALIGTEAIPLDVEAWTNGEPLTDADLKGKVVLLDFWAVWCGPCIATFPHLREWNEKYADKGLEIIGLTRYYNYHWDDEAERASRSEEEVAPEQEREMLVKFAEQHDLHHRFAIQGEDSKLSEHYGVTGIPHVVVIDRQGKVRLMRVGSGEENAKAIGEMIAKLIEEAPPSGK